MSHTHHCITCGEAVAACDGDHCQGDEGHYCSRHHPDPKHKVVDKPTIRMTVKVDNSTDPEAT